MTNDTFDRRLRVELTRLADAVPVEPPAVDRTGPAVQPVRPRGGLDARLSIGGLAAVGLAIVVAASVLRQPAVVAPPSASLTPSAHPTASATPLAITPEPLAPLSPAEFWQGLFAGDPGFTEFPSLRELIDFSDVVAVGSPESVAAGTPYDLGSGPEYNAIVTFRIERVLHGSLSAGAVPVYVAFLTASESEAERLTAQLRSSMPHERGILFLQNLAKWERHLSGKTTSVFDPTLYLVLSAQGVIRDANGTAEVPAIAPGDWPKQLAGRSFDQVWMQIAIAAPLPLPTVTLPASTTPISAKRALEIAWVWEKDHGARLTFIDLSTDFVDTNGKHHLAWRLQFDDIIDMALAACPTGPNPACSGLRSGTSAWFIDATTGAAISHGGSYPAPAGS